MQVTATVERAFQAALKSRNHSHSPYSKFRVGAALQLRGKSSAIGGCNVENASYGGTVCAERVALHAAVAKYGMIKPEFMVVVTAEKKATVPCALCLQSLAEFCADDFVIYLGNTTGILQKLTLIELLPHPFRSFKAGRA